MIGNRKRGAGAFFDQNDVSGALPGDLPTESFKRTDNFAPAEEWYVGHCPSVGLPRAQGNFFLRQLRLHRNFDVRSLK